VALRQGAMIDADAPVPAPLSTGSSRTIRLAAPAKLQLWARMQAAPDAATLVFTVDGRDVDEITPLAPSTSYVWRKIDLPRLPAGAHEFAVRAVPSPYGTTYELSGARLLDPAALRRSQRLIGAALHDKSQAIGAALNLTESADYLRAPTYFTPTRDLGAAASGFWRPPEPKHVSVGGAAGSSGFPGLGPGSSRAVQRNGRVVSVRAGAKRARYTLLRHGFTEAVDARNRGYVFLQFRGTGSGSTYRLFLDFTRTRSASLGFTDDRAGWRTVVLPLATAQPAAPNQSDLAHVQSIRISADRKDVGLRFGLGSLALGGAQSRAEIDYKLLPSATRRSVILSRPRSTRLTEVGSVAAGGDAVKVTLSRRYVRGGVRLLVLPARRPPVIPARAVPYSSSSPSSFEVRPGRDRLGFLVFAQAFDRRWDLRNAASEQEPLPVQALANAYDVPSKGDRFSVRFTGEDATRRGLIVSGAALLAVVAYLVCPVLWRRVSPRRRGVRTERAARGV
jgi:hypothetical protein